MGFKERLQDTVVQQVVRKVTHEAVIDNSEKVGPAPAPVSNQTTVDGFQSSITPAAEFRDDTAADRAGQDATAPTEIPVKGWKAIGKRTLKEVGSDGVPMMASAVAFAGFLSLFPAMIAALAIYGLVTDPSVAAQQAADLTASLPSAAAELITGQMQDVAAADQTAIGFGLVVSVLGALWGASGGMGMLIKGVNIAYDEQNDDRGFVKNKGLAILFALGAIVFVAAAIVLVGVVPVLLEGLGTVGVILGQIGRFVVLAGLIMLALAVLYRYAPDRADADWVWISPGAILATVLWLVATVGFSFFVNNFGSYNETYGTAAGVVVLLLWLQITALIVLFGAEFNAESERQTGVDTTTGPDRPIGQRGAEPADELPPEAT